MFSNNYQKGFELIMLLALNNIAMPYRNGLDNEYAINEGLLLHKNITPKEIVRIKFRQKELFNQMLRYDHQHKRE